MSLMGFELIVMNRVEHVYQYLMLKYFILAGQNSLGIFFASQLYPPRKAKDRLD